MKKYIFDNSNLAESYSGVTTPLTYSFARYVYQEVYKHFCRMMGVNNKVISQNETMFTKMIEFIGSRMYYNLINWYKLVSFLPGYKFNKEFFEKMLGVQKQYSYTYDKKYNLFQKYFIDLPHLYFQVIKISASFICMGHLIKKFNKTFDKVFETVDSIELSGLSLNELKDLYFHLNKKFLSRWRVPIANDFAVMVSTGMADKFFKKWLNETSVYSYLYSRSHNSLISLDPGFQIIKIVASIKGDPIISNLFTGNRDETIILQILQNDYSNHQATQLILGYLKKFGSRTPNELKLETITLNEKPEVFIKLLRNLFNSKRAIRENFHWARKIKPKNYNNLGLTKKFLINWSIHWARNSIKRREEARFRRALIFGYARRIFLNIGQKFQQSGLLDNSQDVFYLTVEEIFDCIQGNRPRDEIRKIIQRKRSEFENWKLVDLPRRIETSKSINEIEKEFQTISKSEKEEIKPRVLRGMVAAKPDTERISGIALVLLEFKPDIDFEGKILVTKQTDPGWTIVFPLLKGLIVERGGMLSHAAIVARELNIPCIVGVDDVVTSIRNGSQVQMDLDKGEVYVQN